jgi:hypothetical protein
VTPPLLHRLYAAGYSVVIIAQRLTAAEGRDVPVGEVCRRLKRAGLTSRSFPAVKPKIVNVASLN